MKLLKTILSWLGWNNKNAPEPKVEEVVIIPAEKVTPKPNISEPVYSFVEYFKKNRKSFEMRGGVEVVIIARHLCDTEYKLEDLVITDTLKDIVYAVEFTYGRFWRISKIEGDNKTPLSFLTRGENEYLQKELWNKYKTTALRVQSFKAARARRLQREEYIGIYCNTP